MRFLREAARALAWILAYVGAGMLWAACDRNTSPFQEEIAGKGCSEQVARGAALTCEERRMEVYFDGDCRTATPEDTMEYFTHLGEWAADCVRSTQEQGLRDCLVFDKNIERWLYVTCGEATRAIALAEKEGS